MHEEDSELLRRYAEKKSEAAFAELAGRHLDLVYSVALRQVGGDAHLAQDVAQVVFTALARKAAALAERPVLGGWLYRTTQFAAIDAVRAESRRRARESEATITHDSSLNPSPGAAVDWEKLRPTLDEVIGELADDDRDAVVMRFFEGKSFADVGARLRLSENTARMRVERALDKLHALLAKRGVTSTSAALAVVLANQAGVAAPAGLAASVTGAALAGTAARGGGLVATIMSISKLQIGIAGALAVAGTTAYVLQTETNAGLRRETAAAQEQQQAVATLRVENQKLATAAAEVEMLRRDDFELKQLEQRVADVKKANEEKARLTQARTQDLRQEFADKIRADDQRAQEEIDRMNREGNALVEEFKALSTQAKDASITPEARAAADAAAQAKLETIKQKRDEIRAFSENVRKSLTQRVEAFRRSFGDDPNSPLPARQAGSGRFELRRTPPSEVDSGNNPPPPTGELKFVLRP